MTSAGPEPGWFFDPDNDERERYWNGTDWTAHRRARQPIATSEPLRPPNSDIHDPAATATPVGHHRQRSATSDERQRTKSRGGSTATPQQPKARKAQRARVIAVGDDHYGQIGLIDPSYQDDEHIFLKFEGDKELYAFEHTEVAPVTSALATVSGSSKPEGRRGRHARVVALGDERQGQIGLIDPAYEDEEHVFLRFEGDRDLYAFERNEIKMVVSPPVAPVPTSASNTMSAPPTPDSAGTSRSSSDSDELTVGGKAKVVAGESYLIHHVGRIVAINEGTVKLKFPGTFGTTTLRRDQVKVVATDHRVVGGQPPRDTSTPDSAGTSRSSSDSDELTVGGKAKVVAGESYLIHHVGRIVAINEGTVKLKFPGTFGTTTLRRDQVKVVATDHRVVGGQPPRDTSTPDSTGTSRSSSDSDELTVGGKAKVVAGDSYLIHHVGRIVAVGDGTVKLKFPGTFGTTTFKQNQVRAISPGPQAGQRPKSPSGESSAANTRRAAAAIQRLWAGLPTAGRIAVVLVPILVVIGLLALPSRTDAEELYLDAMHNPCQHREIFTGSADNCSFVWQGEDSVQVAEGHKICEIEASVAPAARLQATYDYLQPRHPYYTNIQTNTQLIAAEHALC